MNETKNDITMQIKLDKINNDDDQNKYTDRNKDNT